MARAFSSWRLQWLTALLLALGALVVGPLTPALADGIILPPPDCFDEPVPLLAPVPEPLRPVPGLDSVTPDVQRPPPEALPPVRPPLPPIPPRPRPWPCALTIRYHRVATEIANQVAITRVDQVFANETRRDLEGTYLFPLPEDAAVSRFSMWVDGERIDGDVLTREEARRLYESIVRRQRDPALLEYVGRGAFRAYVFPVPAGGERRIELEYQQLLTQENGLTRYVYPLSTERFSARPLQQVAVTVRVRTQQPLKSVYSPSHEVTITRTGDLEATATYEAGNVLPRTNFELVYGVSPDDVGLHVLSYHPAGEDGYFLLLAAPRIERPGQAPVARDVSLVFDTSGSMAGAKIDQARAALRFIVNSLNPGDYFNIVAFSSTVQPFAEGMRPASERERALQFISGLSATGGTNIHDALLAALRGASGARPHTVVFVTDGLPTVGPREPEQILSATRAVASQARLFTFGVGFDVNTTLLDGLAQQHRGASAYVKPGENLEEIVSSFYAKISAPVLTDLQLDLGGAGAYDLYPAALPDLFAGSQLAVVGRYRQPGPADVTLRGTAQGETRRFAAPATVFAAGPAAGNEFLPRLWASRKIGYLLAEIRLRGSNKELIDEIVALATRYGIATPYTSIFVPEPGQPGQVGTTPVPAPPLSAPARAAAADALQQNLAAAPTTGAGAVAKSEQLRGLQEAQAAPAPASASVQAAGEKTFVLVDGVWIDTTFDSTAEVETVQIPFGSDEYFALLDAYPEAARYLAVGERVIVGIDGVFYEVTAAEEGN